MGLQPVADYQQPGDRRGELLDDLQAPGAIGNPHARGDLRLVDIERALALNDNLHPDLPDDLDRAIDRQRPRRQTRLESALKAAGPGSGRGSHVKLKHGLRGGRTMFASVASGTNELEVAADAGLSPSVGGSALAAVVAAVTPAA